MEAAIDGLRIAFLGASALNENELAFCRALGRSLASHTHVTVATSGYVGDPEQGRQSFTLALAQAFAAAIPQDEVVRRIVTFIVQNADGSIPSDIRILGKSIVTHGRHSRNRQGQIVARSDILCLGGGRQGTSEFGELALWIDRPVLPLPFLEGASRQFWLGNRKYLQSTFGISDVTWRNWTDVQLQELGDQGLESLADEVVAALLSSALGKCLVCMPFASGFSPVYERILKPAIASAHLQPVRMDQAPAIGDITECLRAELQNARCVVAVIDQRNPNVLYEVGFAHALNKPVILIQAAGSDDSTLPALPFDIRTHRVISYPPGLGESDAQRTRDELSYLLRHVGNDSALVG